MSDTKFTKGKWVICEVGDTVWIDDEQGFSIAQVYDCKGAIDNAPLIAAAPDMYNALLAMSKGEGLQPGTTIEKILLAARGES